MGKLRVFEAFAGYGSQSMALNRLDIDYEVVAISEIDKFSIKSYEAVHGNVLNLGDISNINTEDIPDHDLFTYSFPCQDISLAGNQDGLCSGSNTRSSLLWECQKVISLKKPRYLLLENVKNLVGKKFKGDFNKWLEWLELQGYTNYWKTLNARDYGIPQNRERVFVVSILGKHEEFNFPDTQDLNLRVKDILEDNVDSKYYLKSDKSKQLIDIMISNNNIDDIITCDASLASPKIKDVSNCITARYDAGIQNKQSMGMSVIEPNLIKSEYRIRKFTPRECGRLMGVSELDISKMESVNSNTQLYKQFGNSIVVDVLVEIFSNMFGVDKLEK